MSTQTYTVERSWSSGEAPNLTHWVTLRGHVGALRCDEPIAEGQSVRISGGRAVR